MTLSIELGSRIVSANLIKVFEGHFCNLTAVNTGAAVSNVDTFGVCLGSSPRSQWDCPYKPQPHSIPHLAISSTHNSLRNARNFVLHTIELLVLVACFHVMFCWGFLSHHHALLDDACVKMVFSALCYVPPEAAVYKLGEL